MPFLLLLHIIDYRSCRQLSYISPVSKLVNALSGTKICNHLPNGNWTNNQNKNKNNQESNNIFFYHDIDTEVPPLLSGDQFLSENLWHARWVLLLSTGFFSITWVKNRTSNHMFKEPMSFTIWTNLLL